MNALLLSLLISVTPTPASVTPDEGEVRLSDKSSVKFIDTPAADVIRLSDYLTENPVPLKMTLRTSVNSTPTEGYILKISQKGADITASDGAGLFYGIQTLLDLCENKPKSLPQMTITDSPRLPYRGMMLDVSRHPRTKDFILKQIRAMERLNLNRLHLHLTDAAGWRIESDKYPRLNSVASWRPEEVWTDWNANGNQYGGNHGGFLTKDELREIVDYAAKRYITVVPEIEMPSHSEEVFAAYPFLSCSHSGHGNSCFCAGSEATFEFIQGILDEVMEVFPSEQIHIGGDEAPKAQWLACDACLKRMKDENLESADHLQSWFIRRVQDYLASKGRKAIVWDDALEGDGPAEGATIMSWRGTEPSQVSLPVIMSPGRYCYLDSYQDAPSTQPMAIGGYTPLNAVYGYEVPDGAVGLQGNLWCEYIATDAHAEYMLYPRMFAVAENAWSLPENKDYDNFRKRAVNESHRMTAEGYNVFNLSTEVGNRPEANACANHLAKGKKVTYVQPYWRNYPAGGETALTDGICGGWNYSDQLWQGFARSTDDRVDVIIDLEEPTQIHEISATFMQICQPDVWMPETVTISVSDNDSTFTVLKTITRERKADDKVSFEEFGWKGSVTARYVRYRATASSGVLFTDEIKVY